MKKLIFALVILLTVASLAACSQPAPAPTQAPAPAPTTAKPTSAAPPATTAKPASPAPAPVTLKVLMSWPKDTDNSAGMRIWMDTVLKMAGGQIVFNYVGATEAVPLNQQMKALQDNVVQVLETTPGYYTNLLPEEAGSANLSQITPWEERKSGYYDLMNQLHQEKLKVIYLGRVAWNGNYYLYTNKLVAKPADFTGQKIRTMVLYDAFIKAMGAVPVQLDTGEIYGAMEKGVVDGFGFSTSGFTGYGWQEVTKYIIAHPFYWKNTMAYINLETWNKLPENLRKVMNDAMLQAEREAADLYGQLDTKEIQKMVAAGMKQIKFADADAKAYTDLAYKVAWDKVAQQSPTYGPKFRDMLTKK